MITYEYPLNEKVRTLLRLEDLYEKVQYFSASLERREHHTALVTMFEILDVATRADLKSELLQNKSRSEKEQINNLLSTLEEKYRKNKNTLTTD